MNAKICLLVTGIAAWTAACSAREAAEEAEPVLVMIDEPAGGATVQGPDVRIAMSVNGIELAPAADEREGTAHHHLFIDQDITAASVEIPAGMTGIIHLGSAQTEFVAEGMAPGEHRVIAVLADWGHVPLNPLATDTVTFSVQP